jgi:hypothetical protein
MAHIVTTLFEGAFGRKVKAIQWEKVGKKGRARDNERTHKEVGEGSKKVK